MRTAAFLACALLWTASAEAQVGNRLAIGGSVTTRIAGSSDISNGANVNVDVRIGHEVPGWGPAISLFEWFNADAQSSAGTSLGNLRVRPLMAGFGYTAVRGRTTITASLVGGFSINSFDPAAGQGSDGSASNVSTLKPGVEVWHDLNDRYALKLSGGYLIARPDISVSRPTGLDTRPVRANVFLVTVGLVYSLF